MPETRKLSQPLSNFLKFKTSTQVTAFRRCISSIRESQCPYNENQFIKFANRINLSSNETSHLYTWHSYYEFILIGLLKND